MLLRKDTPVLYDYISKNELSDLFEHTKLEINHPMTSEEFRILLLPILTSIRDSHTALLSKMYKITDNSRPPILFGLKNDSLIVFATLSEYERFLNKSIITIDGVDISVIIPKIDKLIYGMMDLLIP